MMAGRLPVHVVNDQLEAGLLHVGGHPATHGAQPNESHYHVVLRHPITITSVSVKQPIDGLILSNAVRSAVVGLVNAMGQMFNAFKEQTPLVEVAALDDLYLDLARNGEPPRMCGFHKASAPSCAARDANAWNG